MICAKCKQREGRGFILTFEPQPRMIVEPPQWMGYLCDDCRDDVRDKLDKLLPSYR